MSPSAADCDGEVTEQFRACSPSSSVSRVFGIPELICAIFSSCITKYNDHAKDDHFIPDDRFVRFVDRCLYPRLSGKEAPLLLAHVCRQWRVVALDSPQLWSCLHIQITNHSWNLSSLKSRLCALRFWMGRSRDLPISIALTIGARLFCSLPFSLIEEQGRQVFTEIMELIFEQSNRWEHVAMSLIDPAIKMLYSRGNSYPLLKTFDLSQLIAYSYRPKMDRAIQPAPELRELALDGNTREDHIIVPDEIPSSLRLLKLSNMRLHITPGEGCQIRILVLKNVPLNATLARFPDVFPLLEELSITAIKAVTFNNDSVHVETVILDKVYRLKLCLTTKDCFPLHLLSTPSLRYLTIEEDLVFHDDDEENEPDFIRRDFEEEVLGFLRRSTAPVESFCFRSWAENSNKLCMMLNEMPILATLRIMRMVIPASAVNFLKNPLFCPRLTMIHNDSCYSLDTGRSLSIDDGPGCDNILDLIRARCRKRNNESVDGEICDGQTPIYIEDLALPISDDEMAILKKSRVFQEAEIKWTNTFP